jgi:hypothetical protein
MHSVKDSPKILWKTIFLLLLSTVIYSFKPLSPGVDFLKYLGISKTDADYKITQSLLGGFLDQQGVQQARHIISGDRAGVITDLLIYVKNYVSQEEFINAYQALRNDNKPIKAHIASPEEMQSDMINQLKKSVADLEETVAKADASLKPVFEGVLVESKKQLKEAENPDNEFIFAYRSNYQMMLEMSDQTFQQQIVDWNQKYPENHLQFLKQRLQMFLDETDSIDYSAELKEVKGKKIFMDPGYEAKSKRWKMAFRAGKEAVDASRSFVEQWMGGM